MWYIEKKVAPMQPKIKAFRSKNIYFLKTSGYISEKKIKLKKCIWKLNAYLSLEFLKSTFHKEWENALNITNIKPVKKVPHHR